MGEGVGMMLGIALGGADVLVSERVLDRDKVVASAFISDSGKPVPQSMKRPWGR